MVSRFVSSAANRPPITSGGLIRSCGAVNPKMPAQMKFLRRHTRAKTATALMPFVSQLTADLAFELDHDLVKAGAGVGRGWGHYHLAEWLPALGEEFADFVLQLLRFGGRNQVVPF